MALIELQHVVADMYPVDQDHAIDEIIEGMVITLDANGNATRCDLGDMPLGLAADSVSDTGQTEYAGNVTINAAGATRTTENRVSNQGDETLASGKITVYTGGGKFATDQYDTTVTWTVGQVCDAGNDGQLQDDLGTGIDVGVVVETPRAYPSGVPGTDVQGSTSLGTYLTIGLNCATAL